MPPKSYHCHCASYACAGEVWQRRTIAKHVSVDRARAAELLASPAPAVAGGGKRPRLPDALEKALEWGGRCFDRSNEVEDSALSSSLPHADAVARAAAGQSLAQTAYARPTAGGLSSSTVGKQLPHRRPIVHRVGDGEAYPHDFPAKGAAYQSHSHHRRRPPLEDADDVERLDAQRRSKTSGRRHSADDGQGRNDGSEDMSAGEASAGRSQPGDTRPMHDAANRPSASTGSLAHHPVYAQLQQSSAPVQPQPWAQEPPRPQQQHWALPPPFAGRPFDAPPLLEQQCLPSAPSSVPMSSSYPIRPLGRYDYPLGPAPPVPMRQSSLPSAASSLLSFAAPSLPGSLLPRPLAAFRPTPASESPASLLPPPPPAVWERLRPDEDNAADQTRKRKDSAVSLDSDRPRSGKRSRSSTQDGATSGIAGSKEGQSPPVAPVSLVGSEASIVAVRSDTAPLALHDSPSAMSSSSSEGEGSTAPPSASSRRSSQTSSRTGSSRSGRRRGYRRRSADEALHLPSISNLLRLAPYAPSPQPSSSTDAPSSRPIVRSSTAALDGGPVAGVGPTLACHAPAFAGENDGAPLARASAVAGLTHGELLANPLYRSLVECVQLVAQGRA